MQKMEIRTNEISIVISENTTISKLEPIKIHARYSFFFGAKLSGGSNDISQAQGKLP